MNNSLKKIILLFGDIIMLYAALYLTLLIRYQRIPSPDAWQNHLSPFSLIFLVWLLIFYISDLYNLGLAVNDAKFFQLAGRSIAVAGLISAAFFYLNPRIGIAPKTNLIIHIFIFSFLFLFWRQLFNWLLYSHLPKTNLAVIGYNAQVKELVKVLRDKPHLGYKITIIVNKTADSANDIVVTGDIGNLKRMIKRNKINTIVLAEDLHQSPELRSSLFSCLPLKINFISLTNFYEMATGKVPIEAINQMWFLENLSEGRRIVFDALKRLYDIIFSLIILFITAPVWPLVGLLIKLGSKGPIFFRQIRAGKNNKPFTMIKFRTMTTNNNDHSPTKANDTRITGVGKFLRKTRIDEIPQVLNVLRGDMSFVGPRPERPELIKRLEKEIPFYRERMLVKPGLTGPDQISGEYHSPSRSDTLKKLQYDLYYIKNRSIYLDISIILKTMATMLSRGGI